MATVPFQSFADSSHRRIQLLRHVQCAQNPMHLVEFTVPVRLALAAVGYTLRCTSEAEINKELQLLFAQHNR